MSAGFDFDLLESRNGWKAGRCSIVSIYEDLGARELLQRLCHSLASRFKDDLEFKTDWWRFKYLSDPEISMEAAQTATQADVILLSTPSAELPSGVRRWFEDWLPERKAADGALVFVQSSLRSSVGVLPLASYLRQTAKRAHLDFFRLDSSLAASSPLQLKMNELLSPEGRPMRWGINE
jgi:hypothetical protein